ncbi:MAG: hypothetical protein EPO03_11795 [Porticoccaceae bacterium]|nr:MAG: hypothetical protein EPO03_11795 [Porticoccaceae bacterium]
MNEQERRWQDALRSLEADVDPITARRLTDIRRAALAAAAPRRFGHRSWLPPAVGMAIAAALSFWALGPHVLVTPDPMGGSTQPGMDAAELYDQLDFYSWLADTDLDAAKG